MNTPNLQMRWLEHLNRDHRAAPVRDEKDGRSRQTWSPNDSSSVSEPRSGICQYYGAFLSAENWWAQHSCTLYLPAPSPCRTHTVLLQRSDFHCDLLRQVPRCGSKAPGQTQRYLVCPPGREAWKRSTTLSSLDHSLKPDRGLEVVVRLEAWRLALTGWEAAGAPNRQSAGERRREWRERKD